MNCDDFHDRLHALLGGRLDPSTREVLLGHALVCSACEQVLAVEEALQEHCAMGVSANVPDSMVSTMWPAVRAAMTGDAARSPAPRPAWRRPLARAVVAGFGAIVLVGAGYLMGTRGPFESHMGTAFPDVTRETSADLMNSYEPARARFPSTLDGLPGELTLISSEEVRVLLDTSPRARRWAAGFRSIVDPSDGVQVSEVRDVLAVMPAGSGTALSGSLGPAELRRWLRRKV